MSYATLEKKIKSLPEDYLEEISNYIEFIIFRHKQTSQPKTSNLSKFFGSMKIKRDGLKIQKELRDEWD